jgi:hypothetical protein
MVAKSLRPRIDSWAARTELPAGVLDAADAIVVSKGSGGPSF